MGKDVSIFFGAILRGDVQSIYVGEGTNIQDHAMLHTSYDQPDCIVGKYVTIGHRAIVHGCTIGDESIVGMGAIILDGANVGQHCIIGAQSLVTMGMQIPEGSLVVGVPAKVVRKLSEKEIEFIRTSARNYVGVGREYKQKLLTKGA